VARYSAEEIILQFLSLYNCMDFKTILEEMGVGRFHFLLRHRALREIKALCIALWRTALLKSFPQDAEAVFTEFCATVPALADGSKEAQRLHARLDAYVTLLAPRQDADFLPVADYLAQALDLQPHSPRQRLKLSLILRNLYTLIFNKLV
jgi:hypothetical protein